MNSGKGEGAAYRGRVFLEIKTQINETTGGKESISDIRHADVLKVEPLLHKKKFKLHAVFYDATMLYENDKKVEFEVSIGKKSAQG